MKSYIRCFLIILSLSSPESNLHAQGQKTLQDFISAEKASDRWYAREELFKGLDFVQLRKLKQHCSDNVAVEAAYQILLKSKKEISSMEDGKTISLFRDKDISRFIGFLEGRLKTNILSEWEDALSQSEFIEYDEIDASMTGYNQDSMMTLFKKRGMHIRNLKGQALVQINNKTFLAIGKQRVSIKKEFLQNKMFGDTINAYGVMHADKCIVLFVSDFFLGNYIIACLDRKSGEVQWKNTVWVTSSGGSSGIPMPALAVPVIDGSRVFVYGSAGEIYLECFSMKDGTPLLRFGTTY